MSFTCPRRGCEGFWTPDPDAMAAHRDAHGPEDHTAALARVAGVMIAAGLIAWGAIVLLVAGVLVWFVATGQTVS